MHEITRKLIDQGFYKLKDGHILQTNSWPEEKFDIVANMKSTEQGVIVLGQPKTGNHLTMAILDALGVDRAEELDKQDGISNIPFEDQRHLSAYKTMEDKMAKATNYVMLPHAHIQSDYFPKNFKGKIIHVTRDPRAVAVSAYPFLGAMDHWKDYYKLWDFKNADDFAKHDVQGHLFWGCVRKYDEAWKQAAIDRGYDYLFLKFEDIIRDKAAAIHKIADFMKIKNYDVEKVIEEISIENVVEARRKKFEANGRKFLEIICYRKGQIGSWREELSDEVKKLYLEKYPDLDP